MQFEDVIYEPMLYRKGQAYNPETHVMVRILSKKKLGVDLDTGMVKEVKESKKSKPV